MKPGPEPGSPKARNGGLAVKAKYGIEHFRRIGREGGARLKETGADFSELGTRGGAATLARHGREHYKRIGRKGGKN